jgi:hypothetical protein
LITIELVVAIGLLASAMLPTAYSIIKEQRAARAFYYRAVAIEVVDGEMEILRAGEWRAFEIGHHPYQSLAQSAAHLPPGSLTLTISATEIRLDWRPAKPGLGGSVSRVARLPESYEARAER